jgi:opacity protein-like surface antigen
MNSFKAATRAMLCATAGVFLLAPATSAADSEGAEILQQDPGFYLRGDFGWSFLEWSGGSDDDALTVGAGIGAEWNDYLRSDVRLDWSGNYETTISDLSATTLLGNAYIDIPLTLFTPYAGAGAGWGWVEKDGGGDDSGFTYSFMGGATFGLTNNLALDAGYRFREIILDGADFTDHSISAGALFKF